MIRRLARPTLDYLYGRLGEDGPALPFVRAVVLQVAHPLGRAAPPEREREVAERVLHLLAEHEARASADALASDAELLAAFFQNVDLLFEQDSALADPVSLLVMRAMEIAEGAG